MRVIKSGLVAVVAIIGCGGDSVTAADLFGTYTLSTINGSALPYPISATATIVSDKIVITSDKQWTENGSYTDVQAGQSVVTPIVDGGTVTQIGSEISLNSTASGQTAYSGVFGNSSIKVTSIGFTFFFKK